MAGGCRDRLRHSGDHRSRELCQHPQSHGGGSCDRFPGLNAMSASFIAVRCRGVTKSFPTGDGAVEVLHGIDFEVPAGELTMLVGPSGCGKTTLISIIAGILSPTSGQIETCGKPLTQMSDAEKVAFRRSNIGFIFQQYNLLPALTAAENAAIPLVAAGMPIARAAVAAAPLLERVGMGAHLAKIAEPALRWSAAARRHRPR